MTSTNVMEDRIDILGLTSTQFIEQGRLLGWSRPEALDHYRALFRRGERPETGPGLPPMPIVNQHREGDTIKIIQKIDDRIETEAVILPSTSRSGKTRNTLCVSSQIGCAMGCTFCETAQMGLMKNLTASQIIAQWYAAQHELEYPIDNVVFMGMGEPMDNLDAVLPAIRVFTDSNGPAIAPSKITVSTVGRIEGIRRLDSLTREEGFGRINLAVSVNAPNDAIRSEIMPINRAEPMADLMRTMLDWTSSNSRRVLIEYVLIPEINDGAEHARELCEYLEPLDCTVNIIPYNPRRDSPWPAPRDEDVDRFAADIARHGQFVKRRRTQGRAVMAACGQLGNERIRQRRTLP